MRWRPVAVAGMTSSKCAAMRRANSAKMRLNTSCNVTSDGYGEGREEMEIVRRSRGFFTEARGRRGVSTWTSAVGSVSSKTLHATHGGAGGEQQRGTSPRHPHSVVHTTGWARRALGTSQQDVEAHPKHRSLPVQGGHVAVNIREVVHSRRGRRRP